MILCAVTAGVGLWQVRQVAALATSRAQDILLMQTAAIAQSVIPEQAQALTFTERDLASPIYQRLRREFDAVSGSLGMGGVYTVARRDGAYRFGPESFGAGTPLASQPGTPYREPPPALERAFASGRPQLTPLYTDEFGTAMSAYVPVVQPLTGEVLLVVGSDLHLPRWRDERARAAAAVLGFTGGVLLLLVAGGIVLRRRPPLSAASPGWQRHAEAVWCATVLLVLTAAIAWRLHYAESHIRRATFRAMAQQQTLAVARELWGIRSSLAGLSRSFRSSRDVSRREFAEYASRFLTDYAIQAALWLPAVPPGAVAAVEAEAANDGIEGYRVWQGDPAANPAAAAGRAVYYPLHYIEPFAPHAVAAGFDHGSEPTRARALQTTLDTGLMSGSDPVSLFAMTNRPPGFFVYQKTTSQTQTGVVAFAVNLDAVVRVPMNRVVALPGEFLIADLYQIDPGREPIFLTSTDAAHACAGDPDDLQADAGGIGMTLPIFAFGQTYAAVMHASRGWMAAYPMRHGLHAALGGLILAAALTLLVGFLSQRRFHLEQEVSARTDELRIAHDKLTGILNASPVAMLLLDRDARVLDANPCSERLIRSGFFEYRDEPCGVFLRCVHRHEKGCGRGTACQDCVMRNTVRGVADSGTAVFDRNLEILAEQDGQAEVFHLKFGAAPVRIAGDTQVVIALYDITMWHRTEQLYSTLFNEMQHGFVLLRPEPGALDDAPDFVVTAANPAIRSLIGVDPDTLAGRALRDVRSDIPEPFFALLARTMEGGGATPFSVYLAGLDKHFEGTAFRPLEGQIAVIFTDVTARTRAQDQAREAAAETARLLATTEEARRALQTASEEQRRADQALIYERNLLVALMDSQPDRIFFADAEARFIKVSRMEAQALGLASPEEAVGRTLEELRPGAASRRIVEADREIMRSGRPMLAHVEESVGPEGSIRWDSISKAPIRDAEGRVVGIVGISRDITPQIEMQQQLQHVSKMDAIGRLAGGVAHDFNNLLQAILGFTELLLLDRAEEDPAYDDLKQIERAAGRAIGLTSQLLTFGRKQRIEPKEIEINQVIQATEKMLRRLTGTEVDLSLALAPDTGLILADPSQIEQILMNLTVNAKDAMPKGGRMEIRTERLALTEADTARLPESRAGDFVCLTVHDTGCGIPPDVMAHLFEPFYTTKERGKGTGLGLSVIHGIVTQSRGWINVYTASFRGTTFKIFFPVVGEATARGAAEAPRPRGSDDPALRGDGKTILLVEDDPGVRMLAEMSLRNAGYSVLTCANAAEAHARFKREGERIDALFSDIVMAGQNGVELALDLRRQRPGLPVLLCSGYADDTVRWSAIKAEGLCFIAKPYTTADLLRALRTAGVRTDDPTLGG